ncbi:MAG: hypothetical protein ABI780_07785 [Ardenticatenales bacterium]
MRAFDHGAIDEPWAANARVFGLAVTDGWLYHGVVDSGEDPTLPGELFGYVYRSREDGSQIQRVVEFSLDYGRRSLPWRPWSDDLKKGVVIGQPMLVDIEFTDAGAMIIGMRDRAVDMMLQSHYYEHRPQGDVLLALPVGDIWQVVTARNSRYEDDTEEYNDASQGMLTHSYERDAVVTSAIGIDGSVPPRRVWLGSGVMWLDNITRRQFAHEELAVCWVCHPPPAVPRSRRPSRRLSSSSRCCDWPTIRPRRATASPWSVSTIRRGSNGY